MSNWLLLVLVTVLVLVNVYFTYRREEELDSAGRKMIAAMQLIYLAFILVMFIAGWVINRFKLVNTEASQSSWAPFIIMIVVIVALFVAVLVIKGKVEDRIREEHRIE